MATTPTTPTTPNTPTSAATTSVLAPQPTRREASRAALATTAFFAILRRDIVVTGRDFIAFLLQVLVQPLFFLFIFGKVLPGIGLAANGFAALLLPGIVALTVMTAALQGMTLPLVLDLGFGREIDDRLLAPLPTNLVALEKVIFAAMRGLVAGAVIFPLGRLILGDQFQVRSDTILVLVGVMILTSLMGACLGLAIGTAIKPEQIGLMFSLILAPLLFTGCTYFPWAALNNIKWFQIVTLFNPLTYASEGMRYAMVPDFHGQRIETIALGWVVLALVGTIVVFYAVGLGAFQRRVVS